MQCDRMTTCYHSLIAAVIDRAIDDLRESGLRCGKKDMDRAMAFVLSDTCEAYCLELGIDIEAIREKAAALYRKKIAKEGRPRKARYVNTPGQLSGNRALTVSKKEKVHSSVNFKGQSGARRSSFSVTSQFR